MKAQIKKNPNRIAKVNALLQKLVGEIVHHHLDEYRGLITVSKVESSRDLKWAKVWISIVGGNDEAIFKALQAQIYYIQGELNRELTMKIIPRLQFFLDTSPRYAAHINELIEQLHKEEGQPE